MVVRREWSGTVPLTEARKRGDVDRRLQMKLQVTRNLVDRLGLEKELIGHSGCVNCLEWNADGSILASASDDLHVILWDPFKHKMLHNVVTGHGGNIFSVKFLSASVLATCAADNSVRVRDLGGDETARVCTCHCSRVKRLATTPEIPHMLWSASEDGLIIEHDMREPHTCNSDTPNVLVNLLNHQGRYAEAKCVAINPRRDHLIAVGSNDFYVRVYDRRMIKLSKLQSSMEPPARNSWERQNNRCGRAGQGDPDNNIPRGCVQYFAPGHLAMQPNDHTFPKKATTYIAYSADGTELLVNLGSEQIYLYDVNTGRRPILLESYIIEHNHGNRSSTPVSNMNGFSVDMEEKLVVEIPKNGTTEVEMSKECLLPNDVRELKDTANDHIHKNDYIKAVNLLNLAIAKCSDCAVLYSNRAAALMRRNWDACRVGDIYAAIRDCYSAITLDKHHVKSHFRLAKGLMELKKAREAHECLLYFKDKFPKHANSHAVFLLQKDINVALNSLETLTDEEPEDSIQISPAEKHWRATALDYSHRFLGHCNTTTDIKEANFLGHDGEYIAAGSDDGFIFIWERASGNIVRCLRGDESIVNCVQIHPTSFLMATSGIETTVRLWSPRPEDGNLDARIVEDFEETALANQQRMRSDPFEAMLFNITYQSPEQRREGRDAPIACRTS